MDITRAQALRGGLGVLLGAFAAPAFAQRRRGGGVTGRNVTSVTAPPSTFVQLTGRRWEERSPDGGGARFEETGRDDSTVYLRDRGRGVRIQLNLQTRMVMYSDTGAPRMRDLYQITGASAAVTGLNATSVSYADGAYRMTGPGRWTEVKTNGDRFTFTENSRDEGSVYLVDRSRNVEIQFDLGRGRILYNEVGQPRSPLYEITGSSAQ